jgi:hypothetical protein
MVILCLVLWEPAKLLSNVAVLIYIPTSHVSLHLDEDMLLMLLFVINILVQVSDILLLF